MVHKSSQVFTIAFLTSGSNVFLGYYRDPHLTAAVVDEDGWLHTGDVGEWLENGTLKIIDHKKQIFKLSNGDYVAPETIENIYKTSAFIAQCFVHGDSHKSHVISVVVPRQKQIQDWAETHNIPNHSFTALCCHKDVKKFILSEMKALSQHYELSYYEEVKDIYLHPNLFTSENGLLSSSGKLKRTKLVKYFKPQLEDLYKYVN